MKIKTTVSFAMAPDVEKIANNLVASQVTRYDIRKDPQARIKYRGKFINEAIRIFVAASIEGRNDAKASKV